jgi:hypothetical protein
MRMARPVVNTNYFAYKDKYYLQIRGEAMGLALAMTRENIYMLEWEQSLVEHQQACNELYSRSVLFFFILFSDRCIDDSFMTTNLSFDQISGKLVTVDQSDRNIRIKYQMQSRVDFIDVVIQNDNGHLTTSVCHKPTAEPYILPYTSDHPRHVHRNIPYAALRRAHPMLNNFNEWLLMACR